MIQLSITVIFNLCEIWIDVYRIFELCYDKRVIMELQNYIEMGWENMIAFIIGGVVLVAVIIAVIASVAGAVAGVVDEENED